MEVSEEIAHFTTPAPPPALSQAAVVPPRGIACDKIRWVGVLASLTLILLGVTVLGFMTFSSGAVAYDYITCILILFLKNCQRL